MLLDFILGLIQRTSESKSKIFEPLFKNLSGKSLFSSLEQRTGIRKARPLCKMDRSPMREKNKFENKFDLPHKKNIQ